MRKKPILSGKNDSISYWKIVFNGYVRFSEDFELNVRLRTAEHKLILAITVSS